MDETFRILWNGMIAIGSTALSNVLSFLLHYAEIVLLTAGMVIVILAVQYKRSSNQLKIKTNTVWIFAIIYGVACLAGALLLTMIG